MTSVDDKIKNYTNTGDNPRRAFNVGCLRTVVAFGGVIDGNRAIPEHRYGEPKLLLDETKAALDALTDVDWETLDIAVNEVTFTVRNDTYEDEVYELTFLVVKVSIGDEVSTWAVGGGLSTAVRSMWLELTDEEALEHARKRTSGDTLNTDRRVLFVH
jgi:hypothetical protein